MTEYSLTSDAMKLLHWNRALPPSSATDPLGLNLRVSVRILDELLYCITSTTTRARYYSFFPWAFQNYFHTESGTKGDRGVVKGVLVRERAMVLGAVLHHGGKARPNGGLGGTNRAVAVANNSPHNLATWRHLDAAEGQFGAAYKGSLINLGLFNTESDASGAEEMPKDDDAEEAAQALNVRDLSAVGKRLAEAFDKAVRRTDYVSEGLTTKDTIGNEVLQSFGSRACLCGVMDPAGRDRGVLRDAFFARFDEMRQPAQMRRRMSLLLLMEYVRQAQAAGVAFDNGAFGQMCYFGRMISGDENAEVVEVETPEELVDIRDRWRIFYANSYVTVALQSILVACIRIIRDKFGGIGIDRLLTELNPPALNARLFELTGCALPRDFYLMTARETLSCCGLRPLGKSFTGLPIDAALSENGIESLLVDGEASKSACLALAAVLLYQVVLRYEGRLTTGLDNWYQQQVHNELGDVSLPVIRRFLATEFAGGWLDTSNPDLLTRIASRFVIQEAGGMERLPGEDRGRRASETLQAESESPGRDVEVHRRDVRMGQPASTACAA